MNECQLEVLVGYFLDVLNEDAMEWFEKHLNECIECRQKLIALDIAAGIFGKKNEPAP